MAQKSDNLIVTITIEVHFEDVSGSQKLMNMRSSTKHNIIIVLTMSQFLHEFVSIFAPV